MKKNRKFIYLLSPSKLNKNFFIDLTKILSTNKITFFQLRLKNQSMRKSLKIAKKVKKICKKFNVKFIINDDPKLVRKINADGCHLGQKDMNLSNARKILKKKIIGVTCHNSKKLITKAINDGADYIALGAFYSTKTKKTKHRANIKILKNAKKMTNIPIVAIGGININNYKNLLLNKANFLAISSYIWNNKKLMPEEAVQKLK